ncbi:MAG TPA: GNAT family N-acetyltransferase [Methanomassiliicoccales archaeon]|jgi:GNAT superfamily N-acetyltransferase
MTCGSKIKTYLAFRVERAVDLMGFITSKAGPDDIEAIVDNILRMAKESEGKTLDRETVTSAMKRFLGEPGRGFYLLVRQEGHVVGQCMITSEFSDWRNGEYWWVQSVYVNIDHRRKGFLRALLEEIRVMAKGQGDVFGIRLYVDKDNLNAIEAYRRLGLPPSHYLMMDVPM